MIKNIADTSGDFFKDFFLKCYNKAQDLLQYIANFPSKEIGEEKLFILYVSIMKQFLARKSSLWFKNNYLVKLIVKNTIHFSITLDNPGLMIVPSIFMKTIEEIIEVPIKRRQLYKHYSYIEHDSILKTDYKDIIQSLLNEKKEFINKKMNNMKELVDELIEKLSEIKKDTNAANSKIECLIFGLLSLVKNHFYDKPDILTILSNTLSDSLASKTNHTRSFGMIQIGRASCRERVYVLV